MDALSLVTYGLLFLGFDFMGHKHNMFYIGIKRIFVPVYGFIAFNYFLLLNFSDWPLVLSGVVMAVVLWLIDKYGNNADNRFEKLDFIMLVLCSFLISSNGLWMTVVVLALHLFVFLGMTLYYKRDMVPLTNALAVSFGAGALLQLYPEGTTGILIASIAMIIINIFARNYLSGPLEESYAFMEEETLEDTSSIEELAKKIIDK